MKPRRLLLPLAVVSTCACTAGIRYGNGPYDTTLPKDFVNRVLYSDTGIPKYRLDYLVGSILVCSSPSGSKEEVCELSFDRILKADTAPEATAAKTDIYHSLITQGAAVQGSYLAFAANFKVDQVASVTISDTTLLAVKADDVPVDQIRSYAAAHPPAGGQTRWWIEGALLSVIDRQDSTKIDSNASGVLGSTAGVKGSVYHIEEVSSKDFAIAIFRRNIDTRADRSSLPDRVRLGDRESSRITKIQGIDRLLLNTNKVVVGPRACDLNPAGDVTLSIHALDKIWWSPTSGSGQLSITFLKKDFPSGASMPPLENMTPNSNGDYVITDPATLRAANSKLSPPSGGLTFKYGQTLGTQAPCDGRIIIKP